MNLATWSIRDPIPSVLLFVLLTLAGLWGFQQLRIQNFPDLDVPTVNVSLRLPGAAPGQLETEVARKVEDSIATLQGLRHQRTTITDGQVQMTIEFELERKLSDALVDVKDAVDRVRNDLPQDLEEPQVSRVSLGPGGALVVYAVNDPAMTEEEISWFVDDTISRELFAVRGVGKVARIGGVTREVQVLVDPARLVSLGVTAADVSRALRRVQQDASGGRGELGGAQQGVRTIATVQRPEELAALPIALADGRSIRLDAVATVTDATAERSQIARLDGKAAVGFEVQRSKGYDELAIAGGVEAKIAELAAKHPGMEFTRIFTSATQIEKQYDGSMHMLYEGAILAVLVVWFFLRSWRATVVGAAALPLSIIPTFAFMAVADYALNGVTLLALAVVVGILVDDAIVEIENIARHLRMGKTVRQATEDAVEEIAKPVIATTMTLVAVFAPVAFMSGIPGLFFKQFAWTIVAAVLASLVVARLMTPMMAAWLLRAESEPEREGRITQWYLGAVRWCLTHRLRTALAGVAIFVLSLMLVPLVPFGFIPPSNGDNTSVTVELPPGARPDATLAAAEQARLAIAGVPGIAHVFVAVGTAQGGHGAVNSTSEVRRATLRVVFTSDGKRPTQQQIEAQIRERLQNVPGARFSLGGGGPGEKLSIVLTSADSRLLRATAKSIEQDIRSLGILTNVSSTASLERPEIIIRPDAARAAERGVTTQAIAETVRIATSGDFDQALAKLNLEDRQVDIRVKVPQEARTDLATLSGLRVPGRFGLVPLESVASVTLGSGPQQIDRYDRRQNVTINGDLAGKQIGNVLAEVRKLPSVASMPPGVALAESGDAEMMKELFGGFGLAMLTAILCMYAVLVLLFKDFFQPITILSALPLSIGGAFFALLVGRSMLGMPSLIGLIMLLGIVTKNSILLVEYAILAMRERGLSEVDALVDACRKRARPILMTSFAMIAGMLPLTIGLTADSSFKRPMAIAVIGGLVSSTALSLFIVPVAFTYVSRFERFCKRRLRRAIVEERPEVAAAPH